MFAAMPPFPRGIATDIKVIDPNTTAPFRPTRLTRPIRPTCPTRPTGPPRPPSTLILLPPNLRPPVRRWKCDVFTTGRDSRRN